MAFLRRLFVKIRCRRSNRHIKPTSRALPVHRGDGFSKTRWCPGREVKKLKRPRILPVRRGRHSGAGVFRYRGCVPRSTPHRYAEKVGCQLLSLRHYLPRQLSPRPVEGAQTPNACGLFQSRLRTPLARQTAVCVSLQPFLSKALDSTNSVRISKSLIWRSNSEQQFRTFRIPHGWAERTGIKLRH